MDTTQALMRAKALAQAWVKDRVDLNEAGKMLAYLRTTHNWRGCLELMQRLAATGAVRSQQTRRYYRSLHETCLRHLGPDVDPGVAGQVVGWAFRLGRFYETTALRSAARKLIRR